MLNLTDDAKAILLLCGRFGKGDKVHAPKPLSLGEYNRLADWMVDQKIRPADLVGGNAGKVPLGPHTGIDPERLRQLLSRGASMALAVEKWAQSGIWIVCRSDEAYPGRLKKHLKRTQAPPILFGVGDVNLLSRGGLAVIGSRNVDATGQAFTQKVGTACAREDLPIVSGGARGVDQIAMLSALESGGMALGILADSLFKTAVAGKYRTGIRDKRLVLVSPFHPEARFSVGSAMGRNKLIYALADAALVVTAEREKGGTWAGATEELKRQEHRPVFVRMASNPPEGNRALLKLGARPFPTPPWINGIKSLLTVEIASETKKMPSQVSLFKEPTRASTGGTAIKEQPTAFNRGVENGASTTGNMFPDEATRPRTIYDAVLPVLLEAMDEWKTAEELTKDLQVRKGQLNDWIKRAVKEGKIEKKTRPVCYRRI
jgi:predicted Rossmann fold nucleotide-binding protein DprA/Smf involved in DNA uptake